MTETSGWTRSDAKQSSAPMTTSGHGTDDGRITYSKYQANFHLMEEGSWDILQNIYPGVLPKKEGQRAFFE